MSSINKQGIFVKICVPDMREVGGIICKTHEHRLILQVGKHQLGEICTEIYTDDHAFFQFFF